MRLKQIFVIVFLLLPLLSVIVPVAQAEKAGAREGVVNELKQQAGSSLVAPESQAEKVKYIVQNSTLIVKDGVTEIDSEDFQQLDNKESIRKVVLPASLRSIGGYTFSYFCFSSVDFPDSLARIGEFAFYDNDSLSSARIPNAVSFIGEKAFKSCAKLNMLILYDNGRRCYGWAGDMKSCPSTLVLPDGLLAIDDEAFESTSLQKVVLPDGLQSIGTSAFPSSLKEINIPSTLRSIGDGAFSYDSPLNRLILYDNGTKCYGWVGDSCPSKLVIPDGVVSTNRDAFCRADKLVEVVFPASMRTIGEAAFKYCDELEKVVLPSRIDTIGSSAFEGCYNLKDINLPNVRVIGRDAFGECRKLNKLLFCADETICVGWKGDSCPEIIRLPSSVKHIVPGAFRGSSIKKITLPEGLLSIGKNAFYDSEIEEIEIPHSVKTIEDYVFHDCHSLKKVVLPEGLDSIGACAFKFSGIEQIEIPTSVSYIGVEAFVCSKIKQVTIPPSVTEISNAAFSYCENLEQITIPNSVTVIGECAFQKCGSLVSVALPDSVTEIGDYAFSNCKNLEQITIPNSVTVIGEGAFQGCGSLVSVALPDSVKRIEDNTFGFCSSLEKVHLPASLEYIGAYAFEGCPRLEKLAIGRKVKVHRDAFKTSFLTWLSNHSFEIWTLVIFSFLIFVPLWILRLNGFSWKKACLYVFIGFLLLMFLAVWVLGQMFSGWHG
ncbi:MAG: leucine-rich repeat protein [Paludibacteraceae bacterium]|nr:leucine-rich repeat protein [Paludibacteraceae bacterium]